MRNIEGLSETIILTFFLLFLTINTSAQGVGINDASLAPDPSALLDLNSTNKGFLITRADTLNIASPAFGLMTLAPSDSCLYLYNGINWMGMGGAGYDCVCGLSTGNISFECGMPFTDSRDGKTYGTVEIGNQCWMKENLNYTPSSGNFWCYDNDNSNCDTYGVLYDWYTAMDNAPSSSANPSGVQGICPTNWHLPSDEEWKELEIFLGMTQGVADGAGWRGNDQGDQLKEVGTAHWDPGNTGTNTTSFTALPGGFRSSNGAFDYEGFQGHWWSTLERAGARTWMRSLNVALGTVSRYHNGNDFGYSVRCIKN